MYLVVSGTVEVWKNGLRGERISLAKLQENDYFGEVAIMFQKPRTSNVTAVTTVDALVISREHLKDYLLKYPVIKKVLESAAMKHVREKETDDKAIEE
jgi:CRP-like cAMP-binding protein